MRNINRNSDYDLLVKQLAETPHPATGKSIFPTIRDLLCFAAVLGFQSDRRVPLGKDITDLDARVITTHQKTFDTVCLIALVGERRAEILREENENDMVTVFEEYANGGLEIIAQWLKEKGDDFEGDMAILIGLQKSGFLDVSETSIDEVAGEVSF